MGIHISFTTVLTADQLSRTAGATAADQVTSTDPYAPTVLAATPTLDAAARQAIEDRWTESYPLSVYANREDERFRVTFSTRVANTSDRSDATLAAKIDILAKTTRIVVAAPDLPVLDRSH